MKLYELWRVSPQSFVFVRLANGSVMEYRGGKNGADLEVSRVKATEYPMYKSVLEVEVL